jgi:hypothetical protein
MKREPFDYAVSLLLAPIVCFYMTFSIRQDAGSNAAIDLLLIVAFVVLTASILLPVLFVLLVRWLGGNRDALASAFAPLVRIYLLCVAAVLAAQGCLVLTLTYELVAFDVVRSGLILFVLGAIGIGMIVSAVAVLADFRRMLERVPTQVTGLLVDAPAWPSLHRRIASIASRLKVPAPDHVVISLAPQTFATAGAVRLRGERELDEGITLCVSAAELRVLDENELNAALAAALGVLSAETAGVSRKLIPSFRSLVDCIAFFEEDEPEANRWFKYARIPANGFLAAVLSASRAAMRKVAAARRSEEKRAALEAASARSWAAGLAKASILHSRWDLFRSAYERYMLRGQTRGNLSADFVAHVVRFAQRTQSADWSALASSRLPHPFDVNPTLAEQMTADRGIDTHSLIRDALKALGQLKAPDAALPAIEAHITKLENDYFRVPGRRVTPDDAESTPPELLTAGETAS